MTALPWWAMRKFVWAAAGVGIVAWVGGAVEAVYVFGPLLGLAIWRVGTASFASLRAGGGHIPEGGPESVDPRVERTTYWCEGCGAEVLLLARGTPTPPRHCGERMIERREIARDTLN